MMSLQPVVSFLVYCANEGRYLQQCVCSILDQNFIDFEILILDDASTDETPRITQALSLADSRVRYLPQSQSVGKLASYNHGLEQAKGELLWLISASDALSATQVLQDYVTQFVLAHQLGLIFCRVQCIDANGVPYEKYMPPKKNGGLPARSLFYPARSLFSELLKENLMPSSGVILRKSCFERTGLFDTRLGGAALWHQWAMVSLDWVTYFDAVPQVYQRLPMSQAGQIQSLAVDGQSRIDHYEKLEAFLKTRDYPVPLRRRTRLFRLQLKRKLGLPLSVPEKLIRLVRFFTLR
ncbi:glycosyltransferase family 2 protein [Vampirovibrio sp.]|uniref:glycosyltransferase family 2 protein n=1 Tax=Vampirovibrio sp. TaxID=2717857 RepID=UPI00359366F4